MSATLVAEWTARLERIAAAELGDDGSHDLYHFKRVFAVASAIASAAGEVAAGDHDDEFVLDIYQTGSGTSTNMNMYGR